VAGKHSLHFTGDTDLGTLRNLAGALLAGALWVCAGCSSEGTTDLSARVKELEAQNATLKAQVEKLSSELRPLLARVDQLDQDQGHLGKTLVQAKKDLESRLADMVQQELQGRRGGGRVAVPPRIEVRFEEKPYMGFDAQDIDPDVAKHLNLEAKAGVLVTDVREGSPAAVAGLKKNDVVQRLDDTELKKFEDLAAAFAGKKAGQIVTIGVLRGAEKLELKITLGAKRVRVQD